MKIKPFPIFLITVILGLFFAIGFLNTVSAKTGSWSDDCYVNNPHDRKETCHINLYSQNGMQAWRGTYDIALAGFAEIGNDRGKYDANMCLMFNGNAVVCTNVQGGVIVSNKGIRVRRSISDDISIGNDFRQSTNRLMVWLYVENLEAQNVAIVDGRIVSIDDGPNAAPSRVDAGETFDVSWDTDQSNYCDKAVVLNISGASVTNSEDNLPKSKSNFKVTADNIGGTINLELDTCGPSYRGKTHETRSTSVTVNPPIIPTCQDRNASNYGRPLPCTYPRPTCSPSNQNIQINQTVSLSVSDGDGVNYDWKAPGGLPSRGSGRTFSTKYSTVGTKTVTVESAENKSDTCTVNVTVPPPESFSLDASDCKGNKRSRYIDLDWSNSQYADEYEVQQRKFTNGSWNTIKTTANTDYRVDNPELGPSLFYKIKAINNAGSEYSNTEGPIWCDDVEVSINCNGSSPSCTIPYNTSATIKWSSGDADSCAVSPTGWTGKSGSRSTGNLISSQTYTATCSNQFDDTSDSVTVNVSAPPSPVVDLKCDGSDSCGTVNYNSSKTLSWSITNGASVTSCTASDAWSGAKSESGSESTGPITSSRTWTIQCTGPGGTGPADSVSATVLAPAVDIKANSSDGPVTLSWNTSANLSWSSSNAVSCNASGDWSGGKPFSGSEGTGNLTNPRTYNYTLTCNGNGSTQDSVQVIVNPPVPVTSNVSVTEPNYCVSGPSATVGWTYSDSSGSPQSAYQVQVDDQGGFNSPEVDSGKIACSNCQSYFTGQGALAFNITYRARARTWNSYDSPSQWTNMSVCSGSGCLGSQQSWKTPPYAYPQVDFSWSPTNPPINSPVQFTDQTVFQGNPNGRIWSWLFGDGGSSDQQNPTHAYVQEGSYYITLTATDNANQTCSRTKGPAGVQKPIPIWKEIAPR